MIASLLEAYFVWAAAAIIGPALWVVVWEYFRVLVNDS